MYFYCILIVCLCTTALTEVFPYFFLSCKANARIKPAKTGHGPHSSKLLCCSMYFLCCSMYCFVTFSVLFVCICVLNNCHRVATRLQLNIYHIIQDVSALLSCTRNSSVFNNNITLAKLMNSVHWHYIKVRGKIHVPIALALLLNAEAVPWTDLVKEEEIRMLLTNNSSYLSGSNASERKKHTQPSANNTLNTPTCLNAVLLHPFQHSRPIII
jgi:hypothetical protein